MTRTKKPPVFPWILYDFANTIYSMNILTMYFAVWLVEDLGKPDLVYSIAFSSSMALVALTMPVIGAYSDFGSRRRSLLIAYTLLSVGATAAFGFLAPAGPTGGLLLLTLVLFALSNYGFQGAQVFYNGILPEISSPKTIGRISGYGVAAGYLGAIFGLFLVAPFVDGGIDAIGLDIPGLEGKGRSAAFLPTAVFFLLFSLPLLLLYRSPARVTSAPPRIRAIVRDLVRSLVDTRRYPGVRAFLLANYLLVDAVHTVILFAALYAQNVMGFSDQVKIPFFIVATTGAGLGSFVTGRLADRIGALKTYRLVMWGWLVCLGVLAVNVSPTLFWPAGVLMGALLGGVWTTSRPLLAVLTPQEEHGRFFGLFALSNKAAAIFGPLLWGGIVLVFESMGPARYRLAIASLFVLVVLGLLVLRRVPAGAEGPSD